MLHPSTVLIHLFTRVRSLPAAIAILPNAQSYYDMASELGDDTHRGSIVRSEKSIPTSYRVRAGSRLPPTYSDDSFKPILDHTHRKLKPRHIQLIGIGGYIGKLALSSRLLDADATRVGPLAPRCLSKLACLVLNVLVKHVANWGDRQWIDTGDWFQRREDQLANTRRADLAHCSLLSPYGKHLSLPHHVRVAAEKMYRTMHRF